MRTRLRLEKPESDGSHLLVRTLDVPKTTWQLHLAIDLELFIEAHGLEMVNEPVFEVQQKLFATDQITVIERVRVRKRENNAGSETGTNRNL